MKYKAVGFDYGGVLAGDSGASLGIEISTQLGISFDHYKELYFKRNKLVQRGKLTWEEFWQQLVDEIGMGDKYTEVMTINNRYRDHLKIMKPEMVALVDQVRELGYKTGLLSNNNQVSADRMRRENLDAHFD